MRTRIKRKETKNDGVVFAPASKKQELFIESDTTITVFGGSAGCYDGETEYLSPTGWKKFSDYDGGKVAQWNPKDDTANFVIPDEYIKKPCSHMDTISAKGLNFKLSDEHRVVYFNEHNLNLPKVISFSEMKNRHNKSVNGFKGKVKTTFKVNNVGIPLGESEVRLSVAIQADGCIRHFNDDGTKSVSVRVSKERKINRLICLLES